ncbi:unnamed protein product [Linum trigynum]|uniref:Aminotransferase-like plant mobile domain-containing protein n=2 Tax=Linum trigynum TaxID=586398 RepID=A0AAV2EFK5_9ROSI
MEPMAAEPSSPSIVEVREEIMISPVDGEATSTPRIAHFLKPSISSFKATSFESPPSDLSITPSRPFVSFAGWRYGARNWKLWVEKMAATHKPTWEKAGIFYAVMNSVHEIRRDDDLVFGLAERWCSKTNSFVLPWGEATVTLEDMAVLGFSVLGSPVFRPIGETEELKELEQGLSMAMKEISRSKARKAAVGCWIPKFRDSESLIEHEAFLVAWLSRYVFSNTHDCIRREAFPIAIHLARGIRIALAPAVLASIYRDLGILKREIVNESRGSSSSVVKLWSPFQLVQVWAWERFLQVQPQPNDLSRGEPRLARWSSKKIEKRGQDRRMMLDSAADTFIWRPYTLPVRNWEFPHKFYGEKERWVTLKSGYENNDDDDDVVCFARCLRPSFLVGMDTVEQYFPHRVAMQFGFDQGIPGCVGESNKTTDCSDDAWGDYSRDLDGVSLYVPSRLFEADVTTLYHQWWKQAVVELRRGELLSLSKRDKGSKKLMDKKAGGGKLTLSKKVSKYEEKRGLKTAADGSGSRGLLSQKISAMSYKNAKRKNDGNNGLTDIDRLVKRVRARAYGTRVTKDGSRIDILDPSPVSEAKVVGRDDDDEEEEDMMTIGQLVKANYKHGHAEKIIYGGDAPSSSLRSRNIGGAAETVSALIGIEREAAAESRQKNHGYQNHLDQSSNCQFSVAQDQTPGVGSSDVSSGQLQSLSFSAERDVVDLVSPDREATMKTVMKMEPFEEVMKEVTAAAVAEVENQSNESTVSLSGGAVNLGIRNSEAGGGDSTFGSMLKRLDTQLSGLEKQLAVLKAARVVGN